MNPARTRDRILSLSYPDRRWFAFADLFCAAASAALISAGSASLRSPLGGWPLLIALVPWVARLAAGRFPFRRTPFDLPLAVFLAMAGIGVWAAYEPGAARAKLWMLLAAVLVFYALAGQPQANLKALAGLLALLGAGLALAFLLEHDWQAQPADLQILNQIGKRWMAVRPRMPIPALFPNMAGGIIAMCLPFSLAFGLQTWHDSRRESNKGRARGLSALLLAGLSALLMAGGLLFTSSRAAWLALASGMGVWLLWEATGLLQNLKSLSIFKAIQISRREREAVFIVGFLMLTIPLISLALAFPNDARDLANAAPGAHSASSRAALARNTMDLVAEYPFTGSGLASFPGQYSQYIVSIPFFLYNYAHNFYLDVALEQGLPGLLALIAVFAGCAWLLVSRAFQTDEGDPPDWLMMALPVALTVVGIHGLLDDPLYGGQGTPLLLVLPGMAVALTRIPRVTTQKTLRVSNTLRVWVAVLLALLLALGIAFRKPLLSAWYADLGALQMARVDLAGFPTGEWVESQDTSALAPAVTLFQQSLAYEPDNRTANYRLGLVALRERDFPSAIEYLEKAYQPGGLLPDHRGVLKNLAYAYVWAGRIDTAIPMMKEIPEAEKELNNYVWFWRKLDRNDLASNASLALSYLQAAGGGE